MSSLARLIPHVQKRLLHTLLVILLLTPQAILVAKEACEVEVVVVAIVERLVQGWL